MNKVYLIFLLIFILVGCGASAVNDSSTAASSESRTPAWVLNPQRDGYQLAVGAADKTIPHYERAAYIRAQAELARHLSLHIESVCEQRTAIDNGHTTEEFHCATNQSTQQLMASSEKLDTWENASHFYVLLGVMNEDVFKAP
ncbi:LPP20 family lipoprotein [Marinospirillum perlucidum]|uniref:LPP20 family lipoprotein n=1 Tax=Marinospirillum perlucidum TaxID=1982602 RepID=UPI00138FF780|nr:LPP20 family lipoprotein [Marinospirillum perlucidum]